MHVFAALADETRRDLLAAIAEREQTVGELTRRCGITQPAVSRHLRVLRECGFVRARVAGQQRIYQLHPDGFRQLAGWLDRYRTFWEDRLDRFEAFLAAQPE
jgi:DNA-binding transcriptional ArsR family regulator